MKRLVSAIALVIAISAPAAAQTPDTAAEARIRADVTFLADDLLEGRSTGRRGYDLAARYVETRFMSLGLAPGGDARGESYRQPITFVTARGADDAALSWSGSEGGPVTWTQGQDVAIGPSRIEGPNVVEAPVVFVGYGVSAPEAGVDDYADVDVRGKIVVVIPGTPSGLASDVAASLGSSKVAAARAHGAVGLLTVTPAAFQPGAQPNMNYGRSQTGWLNAEGQFTRPDGYIGFTGHLSPTAADALLGGRLEAIKAQAAAGSVPGFEIPGRLSLRTGTAFTSLASSNVAGLLRGSDPAHADELVIIMAHLDGLEMKTSGDDRINNGAMDNAGGVAIMLEAARILAADPPKRSVLFLAVAAEELGLLGSSYHAANPIVPPERIMGVVNLDMPMLSYDFQDVIAFGAEHSTLGGFVDTAAEAAGVTQSPDPMPEQGVFTRSDHYAFVRAGVPSVMLATGYANGGEAVWGDFFANRYHKPADDMSQVFNWSAAARFARLNAAIAHGIAESDERPRWCARSLFGAQFAPSAEKASCGTN